MLRSNGICALAALLFVACCAAQEQPTLAVAKQVQADVALLAAHSTLGGWRKTHPGETLQLAGYQRDDQKPESDFSTLPSRCAISVAHEPAGGIRSALFVVPPVTLGNLPPLPTTDSPSLIESCRLEEIWFDTDSSVSRETLIRVLATSWGQSNGPSAFFRDAVPFVGFRKNLPIWQKPGMDVWVVNRIGPKLPVAVYARNHIAPETDWYDTINPTRMKVAEQSAATVANIAALDPVLTKAVLARTVCTTAPPALEDPQSTARRLEIWLNASKTLTPSRRAAALLIADSYISCTARAPQAELNDRYVRMGAEFNGGCPQDPEYGHNFRNQAEDIDKEGVAGELAALAGFWDKCLIAYGPVLESGERLARRFPEWRPYLRYALARSHDAALSRDYPGGSPEEGLYYGPPKYDAAKINLDRAAAIRDFTSFLREKPEETESTFAWQEIWRLRAGLKPTRVRFGCSCE